ncbi:antimicrobial ginkbilobin-2-like protein [Silene latifolia]|uniref:antimicrobial ginkbilobin-2-like protein n=1 Tax=Silene latifolia TaxID=37657 RepID=UPI003D77693B
MITFSHQKITCVAVFVLFFHHITDAKFIGQDCYDGVGKYSSSSDYGTNINTAIGKLGTLASTTYFNNISVGTGTDKVNALFSCRYDIASEDCQICVASTIAYVPLCLRSVEGIQFYQECTLHYSNYTIFSFMEETPRYYIHGLRTVSDDGEFSKLLSTTFTTLINDAVSEFAVSSRYFATATADYSTFETIYALAQCNEDLTSSDCNKCLEQGFGNFTETYPGAYLGQVFSPSCTLSYKLSSVTMTKPYDFSVPISDSPDDGSTPPPPTLSKFTSTPGSSGMIR